MTVYRFSGDPFRELAALQERLNRAFDASLSRGTQQGGEELYTGQWVPPVDIYETKDKLVLKAELPGLREEQIRLRFDDGVLTLEGERKFEKETGDETYHRVERSYGAFQRAFTLPASIAADRISASFDNGLLTVELPKRDETKPKQIKIGTGKSASPIEVGSKQG
jgi:HSP20 family protein